MLLTSSRILSDDSKLFSISPLLPKIPIDPAHPQSAPPRIRMPCFLHDPSVPM